MAVEGETDARLVSHTRIPTDGSLQSVSAQFFEHPELSLPYTHTTVYIDYGGPYFVVPVDFLRQGIDPSVWLSEVSEESHVLESMVADQHCGVIYSVPRSIHEFCERSFALQSYAHPIVALLSAAGAYSRRSNPDTLIAVVHSSSIDIVFFKDDRLKIANRYPIRNEVDALYYLTAAWRHFELTGATDQLALFGENTAMLGKLRELLSEAIDRLSINDYAAFGARVGSSADLPPLLQFRFICA